jgi:hypothetical protein
MTTELFRGLYVMSDEVFQDVYGPANSPNAWRAVGVYVEARRAPTLWRQMAASRGHAPIRAATLTPMPAKTASIVRGRPSWAGPATRALR